MTFLSQGEWRSQSAVYQSPSGLQASGGQEGYFRHYFVSGTGSVPDSEVMNVAENLVLPWAVVRLCFISIVIIPPSQISNYINSCSFQTPVELAPGGLISQFKQQCFTYFWHT